MRFFGVTRGDLALGNRTHETFGSTEILRDSDLPSLSRSNAALSRSNVASSKFWQLNKTAIHVLLASDPESAELFCQVFGADFLCFGYFNEWEALCGKFQPVKQLDKKETLERLSNSNQNLQPLRRFARLSDTISNSVLGSILEGSFLRVFPKLPTAREITNDVRIAAGLLMPPPLEHRHALPPTTDAPTSAPTSTPSRSPTDIVKTLDRENSQIYEFTRFGDFACNLPPEDEIFFYKFVESAKACEKHCAVEWPNECVAFQFGRLHHSCVLFKSPPSLGDNSDFECGMLCVNHDDVLHEFMSDINWNVAQEGTTAPNPPAGSWRCRDLDSIDSQASVVPVDVCGHPMVRKVDSGYSFFLVFPFQHPPVLLHC